MLTSLGRIKDVTARTLVLALLLPVVAAGCGAPPRNVAPTYDARATANTIIANANATATALAAPAPEFPPPPTSSPTNIPAPNAPSPTESSAPTHTPTVTATLEPTAIPRAQARTSTPVSTAVVTPTTPPTATSTPRPTPTVTVSPTAPGVSTPPLEFFPIYPNDRDIDTTQLTRLLPAERRTGHFTVHYRRDSFASDNLGTFVRDTGEAIDHVRDLLGVSLRGPLDYYLSYTLFPPPDPGLRGFNRHRDRMIFQLYDGSGTRLERQYMSAHETTHQIASDSIGPASSTMLAEGLAMYTGQQYLLEDGDVSLDGLSRAALDEGKLIPISRLSDGSVRFMGRLPHRYPYDEAGSFVQFLIKTYGLSDFKRVYTNGDYAGVYGKSLSALDVEWVRYLRSKRSVGPFPPDSARYIHYIEAVQDAYARLFEALSDGRNVMVKTYRALDGARIAADRAGFRTAETRLREYERTFR